MPKNKLMSILAIDLGGTKITGAAFDNEGVIIGKHTYLLNRRSGKEVGILVRNLIDELIASYAQDLSEVQAIGICVPGIANIKTGKVWTPNIPGWDDYPLLDEIAAHTGNPFIKIHIASDRTCYILGEVWKGAAVGCKDAIFIAVGTGIGAGIMIDGQVLHGHSDIVGASGWMALQTPFLDEYKQYGCFESHASGNGIAMQAKKNLQSPQYANSMLHQQAIETITAHHVFEAYEQRDELAVKIVDEAIGLWGMAAANLVSLLNPEIIIWGGGVFGPASRFIDRIYMEANKWAQPVSIKQVRFVKSTLTGDAGLLGAAYLGIKN
jgi:glucokinase